MKFFKMDDDEVSSSCFKIRYFIPRKMLRFPSRKGKTTNLSFLTFNPDVYSFLLI